LSQGSRFYIVMNVELQRALAERNGDANTLEHDFVQQVYDEIAPHFSDTRYRPWPVVKDYLDALPTGSCVADVVRFCAATV